DLVVKTFQKVRAGQLALDPTIDVVTTLNLTREKILERMPHNLPTMTRVLGRADEAFKQTLRSTSQVGRTRARRDMWRNLHKALALAEEMSPRIDLLDRWSEDLRPLSRELNDLLRRSEEGNRSATAREARARAAKLLRERMLEARSTPGDLARMLVVL